MTASTTSDLAVRASIIIVSYNSVEKLLDCLRSVIAALPSDCELVVIDNASIEGNADAIATEFPMAVLVRSSINHGFGGGANRAAYKARGRFLVFLNPDTHVEQGWIDPLLAPLEAPSSNVALTTPCILLAPDQRLVNTCGCDVHITGISLCRGLGKPREDCSAPAAVCAISGAAFAISKDLFETLGGFDEEMFMYMEDIDLSMRALLAGLTIEYVPESQVAHDYELRITPLKVFWQERNRYIMLLKTFRWPTLIVLLPSLVLAEVIGWGFVLLRDRSNLRNKLRAYTWIVANWRKVMRNRRAVQSMRSVSDREVVRRLGYRLDFSQAGEGPVALAASLLFNPLFLLSKMLSLCLVWW
jgi:GT2 family glycosyltransferase